MFSTPPKMCALDARSTVSARWCKASKIIAISVARARQTVP
jgi:hypothetical protein